MLLQIIYCLSSLFVLINIVTQQNPISPISLFGLGTIIYGLPLFWGYTTFVTGYENQGADVSTYFSRLDWRLYLIFLFLHLLFFTIAFFFQDSSPKKLVTNNKLLILAINVDLIICLFLFLKNLGWNNLWISKLERIQYISSWYSFAAIFAVLAILYWCLYKPKTVIALIPPIFFLILDVFMGYRTTVILGFISVCLVLFWQENTSFNIVNKVKLFLISVFAILAAFIYKPIYYSLEQKIFQVNYIISEILENSFIGSEPFVTMGVLNETIKQNINVNNHYIWESLIQYIPFYETITGNSRISFNFYVQNTLFPEVSWGLASTSLGELYVIGGFVAVSLWWTFLFFFLRFYPKNNSYLLILYCYLAPYILFYFYRNDWHYIIGVMRLLTFCCVGIFYTYLGLKVIQKILTLAIKK
ncbi:MULTISPECIES: oligosaccharide repeat unit polymerase [Spirulina sp. CCY15215]|uniref:oligosaccharide repeat unit polymerase n=1 Tax=Spirulina sp. CCY15215 TaxID=2767591 RepID=UPI0019502ABE